MTRGTSRRTLASLLAGFLLTGVLVAVPALAARPKCLGKRATMVGTRGDDTIRGTRRADVIVAKGGSDLIFARGGNDIICAGGGDFDAVFAGGGRDRIAGGGGFDAIFPGGGNDTVNGGRGFDLVTYEGQPRAIRANLKRDVVRGLGTDRLSRVEGVAGGEGNDTLIGNGGNNDLLGYGGNDTIRAGGGSDFMNSGAGDDTVNGGPGPDFVDMLFSNAGPRLGDDTPTDAGVVLDLSAGTAVGPAGVGTDTLVGVESASGTLGDDTLTGSDDFNHLISFEGNDTIDLGAPGPADPLGLQDIAAPGEGDDTVVGSTGMDLVDYGFVSVLQDPVSGAVINLQNGTATGGIGTDSLTSIEAALGTIHDDQITGSASANLLIGIDGSDTLSGEAGDDVLDGDAFVFGLPFELDGTDTLDGGPGTDTCLGGNGADANCESSEFTRMVRYRTGSAGQPALYRYPQTR